MFYKRPYKKKRFNYRRPLFRKRVYRKRRPKIYPRMNRNLLTNYFIKRKTVENIVLSPTVEPVNWNSETGAGGNINALWRQWTFSLDILPQYGEFQNLFTSYKINAVQIKIYPATGIGGGDTALGTQVLVQTNTNPQGVSETLDQDYFLQAQNAKRQLLLTNNAQPINLYMKLKQLSLRYRSVTDSDYATVKPGFVSTGEPSIVHYGSNIRFSTINASGFNNIALRMETTYYIQFRQIK